MAHVKCIGLRHAADLHIDAAKLRERIALRRIISQQILRPQFIADLLKCLVQLRGRCRIIELPARVVGELNQRVLAAGLASGAAFNRHNNDRVDDRAPFSRLGIPEKEPILLFMESFP